MTKHDFHGDEYHKYVQQQYDAIRIRRKAFHGKPDELDYIEITLDRMFEAFYKSQL